MNERRSLYSVNILFLIVLTLQTVNFFFLDQPHFLRLILNEAFFVLLPALIYLRWAGLPFRKTVKWQWPGWSNAGASLLIGAGLYPLSVLGASFLQSLLGYQIVGAEQALPNTTCEAVLAIIAFAFMAPLCEEILARGIIQRAYERLGARRAILVGGVYFIIFHLSLLQGLTIIPLTLALGYVYWRSGSLVASILTHFGANFLAALVLTSEVFSLKIPQVLFSPYGLGICSTAAVLGFLLLRRTTPEKDKARPMRRPPLRRLWPLALSLLLFLAVISVEFIVGRNPEYTVKPITIGACTLAEEETWNYEIRNIIAEPVGTAQFSLAPQGELIVLHSDAEHRAYSVDTGRGHFMSSDGEEFSEVSWVRESGQMIQGNTITQGEGWSRQTQWTFDGGLFSIITARAGEAEQTFEQDLKTLGKESFVASEESWPWLFSRLPFSKDYCGGAYLFKPYTWRNEYQDSGPLLEFVLVTVTEIEAVTTPHGDYQAWKVAVGQKHTAWYTVDAPHVLLKWNNGIETYLLQDPPF